MLYNIIKENKINISINTIIKKKLFFSLYLNNL